MNLANEVVQVFVDCLDAASEQTLETASSSPAAGRCTALPEDGRRKADGIDQGHRLRTHTGRAYCIDETIGFVVERAHVGNIHVNRNVVGAVAGVQPFGGEGFSGTGPKAGRASYLRRLLSKRPTGLPPSLNAAIASDMILNDVLTAYPNLIWLLVVAHDGLKISWALTGDDLRSHVSSLRQIGMGRDLRRFTVSNTVSVHGVLHVYGPRIVGAQADWQDLQGR
jgi:hypothetical protein